MLIIKSVHPATEKVNDLSKNVILGKEQIH